MPKGSDTMPTKPKRPCRFVGCPKLTDNKSGFCNDHEKPMQRHYNKFTRGYDNKERYGGAWQKVRNRHIRQYPLCELCKRQGKYVTANLVHHIKPIADGGTNDENNLMSLCVSCHEKIHRRNKKTV